MKRLLALLVAIGAILIYPAASGATGHQLVVDGVTYESTHEAGSTIHWETNDVNPQHAEFYERSQTWDPGDNGSEHLPCAYGIHWVSNDNVLTISHCLEAPSSTTGPTTTSPTTTTIPISSTSIVATTTTVPETTPSTSSPETSTGPSTTTSVPASTVPSPSTTLASTQPPTTLATPTTSGPTTTISPNLPKTGRDTGLMAVWAGAVLLVGSALIATARRRA